MGRKVGRLLLISRISIDVFSDLLFFFFFFFSPFGLLFVLFCCNLEYEIFMGK